MFAQAQRQGQQGAQIVGLVGHGLTRPVALGAAIGQQIVQQLLLQAAVRARHQRVLAQGVADQTHRLQPMAVEMAPGRGLPQIARVEQGPGHRPQPAVHQGLVCHLEPGTQQAIGEDRRLQAGFIHRAARGAVHRGPGPQDLGPLRHIGRLTGQLMQHGQGLQPLQVEHRAGKVGWRRIGLPVEPHVEAGQRLGRQLPAPRQRVVDRLQHRLDRFFMGRALPQRLPLQGAGPKAERRCRRPGQGRSGATCQGQQAGAAAQRRSGAKAHGKADHGGDSLQMERLDGIIRPGGPGHRTSAAQAANPRESLALQNPFPWNPT